MTGCQMACRAGRANGPRALGRAAAAATACLLLLLGAVSAAADADAAQPAAQPAASNVTSAPPLKATLAPCMSYAAAPAEPLTAQPSVVLSPLLVSDVNPLEGVFVKDLKVDHPKVSALQVTLHWLPYSDIPPTTSAELDAQAKAKATLKDIRTAKGAASLADVSFSDVSSESVPASLNVTAAAPPAGLNGTFKPVSPLAAFAAAGLGSKGLWVLRVADMGEDWAGRTIQLKGWSLVLCPPANASTPALDVALRMSQQQSGFDLGAAVGAIGGGAGAGRLAPARGTVVGNPANPLVNVATTVDIKGYSDLADDAVDSVIGAIDNIQSLLGLPRTPQPLISRVLPWFELLIGGTDFNVQNVVWPGKIVNYALQLEVMVRTRAAMAANATAAGGTTGNTTSGTTGGSSSGGATRASAAAGADDGTDEPDSSDAAAAPAADYRAAYDFPPGMDREAFANSMCRDVYGPKWMFTEGSNPPTDPATSVAQAVVDGFRASTPDVATDLYPMNFDRRASNKYLNAAVKQIQAFGGQLRSGPDGSGSSSTTSGGTTTSGRRTLRTPLPASVEDIVKNAVDVFGQEDFGAQLKSQMDVQAARAQRVEDLAGQAAKSPIIKNQGQTAQDTAKALHEGAKMYNDIVKSALDNLKRLQDPDLMNKTKEYIKSGDFKNDMDNGAGRAFIWNLNRIRLVFRWSAQDGPTITFQQWLYNINDVNAITTSVRALEKLDAAAGGAFNSGSGSSSGGGSGKGGNGDKGKDGKPGEQFKTSLGTDGGLLIHAPGRPVETSTQWFNRIVGEAEKTAKRALSRIPIDESSGVTRIVPNLLDKIIG